MAKTYAEKFKDPRWQKKRLEILERDGFSCVLCGTEKITLHVHHGYYERGFDPWEYESETLWTLCEECHEGVGNELRDCHLELARLRPGPDIYGLVIHGLVALRSEENT